MISAVQYGGRVTDDYDNRLLLTFTRVWFSDQLFSETFQFYKGYGILAYKNIPEYLEAIETMKTVDPPQAYGLHSNADITLVILAINTNAAETYILVVHILITLLNNRYQRSMTADLLDTILSIQPKESSAGGGETREASVYRQTKEMLEKVPPNFDPHEVRER